MTDMAHDPIIERIKKLLALSQSTNEAEAALASERVQELLLRHNLDINIVGREKEPSAEQVETDKKARRLAHEFIIASVMCDLFDVKYFQMRHNKGGKTIVFIGLSLNIESALLTFNYLNSAINEFAKARKGELSGLSEYRDYKLGAAERIRADIRKHKEQQNLQLEQNGQALVLVSKQIAQKAYDVVTKGFGSGSRLRGASNQNAYSLGYSDGARINPHAARGNRQLGSA
jgi:hypothetical protein